MKLFDKFEAIKFPEENLIFITKDEYLYYIFELEYKTWRRYENAGYDHLTISNYQDVSRGELIKAMGGKFPTKEIDFIRLCDPSDLYRGDLYYLLKEDYSDYMSDEIISNAVYRFLSESAIRHRSYFKLRTLFDNAISLQKNKEQVFNHIKELSFEVIGRDIFKKEIDIVDWYKGSSYFLITLVRVIDDTNTNDEDNVAEMYGVRISIEENDVEQYLEPFLEQYFDDELEANKRREDAIGYEWHISHNFYTFEAITNILKDMRDTIDALTTGKETEYIVKLREKRGFATYVLISGGNLSEEQIKEYNDNRPKEDDTPAEVIIDFYERFIYRMEYMMRVGKEKGYNLISFIGP